MFVQNCQICQQAKTETTFPVGLLQPLPNPIQVWDDIAMDFIIGLPPSQGCTVIMVIVDRLSKFGHFIPMRSDFNNKQVADVFINNVVKLHDIPKSIVSDRDKVFVSSFWKQLWKLQGTTLAMSSAYHPQTDDQSEVLNKTLEMYHRCFSFNNPIQWSKMLPWAQYWYNTSHNSSIGMPPYKALYGQNSPTLIKYQLDEHDSPTVQANLLQRDTILEQVKLSLLRAQNYMKQYADMKRRSIDFQVGDLVLVKLQPYKQQTMAKRLNQKLGLKYFGPFSILAKVGTIAYRLQLPDEAKIHSVFHAYMLKKFRGQHNDPYIPIQNWKLDHGPILLPWKVLASRTLLRGQLKIPQVLIHWQNTPPHVATWENVSNVEEAFPSFNLEDKVASNGDGIVTGKMGRKEKLNKKQGFW